MTALQPGLSIEARLKIQAESEARSLSDLTV
jgi:hypothetical protein